MLQVPQRRYNLRYLQQILPHALGQEAAAMASRTQEKMVLIAVAYALMYVLRAQHLLIVLNRKSVHRDNAFFLQVHAQIPKIVHKVMSVEISSASTHLNAQ
jgi:hypothetical protein